MNRIIVDNFPTTGKTHDKFGQTGKGDFDIHNVHSCHVECVTLLLNQNVKAKHHMNISVNAEDYYRIKDSEKER